MFNQIISHRCKGKNNQFRGDFGVVQAALDLHQIKFEYMDIGASRRILEIRFASIDILLNKIGDERVFLLISMEMFHLGGLLERKSGKFRKL